LEEETWQGTAGNEQRSRAGSSGKSSFPLWKKINPPPSLAPLITRNVAKALWTSFAPWWTPMKVHPYLVLENLLRREVNLEVLSSPWFFMTQFSVFAQITQ
jgi:hypothetical protein